jgi:hypothetical protein
MKRMLWLGIGLAVGALVVRAVTKKAQSLTPQGIAGSLGQSAGGLLDSVRSFVDDVRDGMAEREQEIHAAFAEGAAIDDAAIDDAAIDDAGTRDAGGPDDEFILEYDPKEGTR